jgi:WhiB family transcriptional regulator, redox-sensing transcriptional regulator
MHCHFERQHLAARGDARVRAAAFGAYLMPTQVSWSIAGFVTTNSITPKPWPRPLVTSQ